MENRVPPAPDPATVPGLNDKIGALRKPEDETRAGASIAGKVPWAAFSALLACLGVLAGAGALILRACPDSLFAQCVLLAHALLFGGGANG